MLEGGDEDVLGFSFCSLGRVTVGMKDGLKCRGAVQREHKDSYW